MSRLKLAPPVGLAGFAGLAGLVMMNSAHADWMLNFRKPVTDMAQMQYDLHVAIMWVITVIFIAVFGVMFYSLFKHTKASGRKPATFSDSHTVEIIWTVIPFFILLAMAFPATKAVLANKDTSNADMTIKVTGYQWKWGYDYIHDGFGFLSQLKTPITEIKNEQAKNPDYLLEVDNPMVVPAGKKVRLLITAADVIHAWYMPTFGVQQDATPGFINDAWFQVDKPGRYTGQCAKICGKEHAFMPIVVDVKSPEDYAKWVKEQKAKYAAKDGKEGKEPVVAAAATSASAAAFPVKLYFASGKTELPADAEKSLAAAVDALKADAKAKLDLSGYVDATGNADQNAELAKNRAKAVREALKKAGIAEDRLNMKKPEVITASADASKEARRVEINLSK
ncbi:MAG: hypothetical protein RLZZ502_1664 [Pseudomonadota bacterium]